MKDILTIVITGVVLFILDIVTSPPGYYNCLDHCHPLTSYYKCLLSIWVPM
jgi:hypothetical protein